MNIYTLYIKTHRITGLKYLGKTEQDDVVSYQGSGVYWTKHIKKHGYNCDTEIIKKCHSSSELKEWGLYYSRLWNIVDSDEWANLKEECGDGWSSDDASRLTQKRISDGSHNCLLRGDKAPRHNSEIIHLIHKDGGEFIGTRMEFLKTVPKSRASSLSSLLSGDIRSTVGWRLSSANIRQQDIVHTFVNDDGRQFTGTATEFRKEFCLNQGNLWALINKKNNGKHHVLGWRITKPLE